MSKITDSAIEYKVNNSRAVSLNGSNSANKAFCIDRDGTLWAAFYATFRNINVYKSIDNGFSWEWVTNIAHVGRNGTLQGNPLYFLKSNSLENIYLVTTNGRIFEIPSANLTHNPEYTPIQLSVILQYIPATNEYISGQDTYRDGLFTICGDPDSVFYVFYTTTGNYLKCAEYSMVNSTREQFEPLWELWPGSETLSTISATAKLDCVAKDRYCYVAYTDQSDNFRFTKYDKQSHLFGSGILLSSADLYAKDPTIAVDGNTTLLAAYGDVAGSNTDIDLNISVSTNQGDTWVTSSVSKPFGTTAYIDATTGLPEVRLNLLGDSVGGFVMTAIFTSEEGVPTLYAKKITTQGIQESWEIVNSKEARITGNQFFKPFNDRLPYFGDMSSIRSAFQVGDGNDEDGNDTVLTSVFQESLVSNAYSVETSDSQLSIDPLTSGFLRVDYRVVGSLDSLRDYYNENVVGENTDAYIKAINKIGISVKVKSFEPVEQSTDTGKGSYSTATEHTTKVLIDPQTYDFPAIAKETSVFTQFIERDIRKAFFKPDFFMHRNYIVNDGGYIKRTVWTLSYIGNEYEISQIVPRFINNEICFYEANLYVIGPSNDPFRKLTLPSET
jgi:hypothetical protein